MISKNSTQKEIVEIGKKCNACGHCCKYTTGFMTDKDITKIADKLGMTETELKEKYLEEMQKFNTKMHRPKTIRKGKPYGPCTFLKENKCSIHDVKPLQCRTGNCSKDGDSLHQWFDLNFFVNPKDSLSIREYACALKTRNPINGGTLQELVPDKQKLKKIMEGE